MIIFGGRTNGADKERARQGRPGDAGLDLFFILHGVMGPCEQLLLQTCSELVQSPRSLGLHDFHVAVDWDEGWLSWD